MIEGTLLLPLENSYKKLKKEIVKRLEDFSKVTENEYFYELCFCICTPQSKAINAIKVQSILMEKDFYNKPFNTSEILRNPNHYIRFHNQKANRLLDVQKQFNEILQTLTSGISPYEKRIWLVEKVKGFGMKESSHFLRNIGCRGLAILDRHVLKHLVLCSVFEEIPKITSIKQYLGAEQNFKEYAEKVGISIDELDLLFWSNETGEILK